MNIPKMPGVGRDDWSAIGKTNLIIPKEIINLCKIVEPDAKLTPYKYVKDGLNYTGWKSSNINLGDPEKNDIIDLSLVKGSSGESTTTLTIRPKEGTKDQNERNMRVILISAGYDWNKCSIKWDDIGNLLVTLPSSAYKGNPIIEPK